MGGPQCRLLILRNANVPCHYFCNFHVDVTKTKCCLSNLRKGPCHVTDIFSQVDMLHVSVSFKKWLCRHVDFKGHGPQSVMRWKSA